MNIRIKQTDSMEEKKICAQMLTENEPWKRIGKEYTYHLSKFTADDTVLFVAMDGEEIIGCLLLETGHVLKPFVRALCVKEGYRNQHIGQQLLRAAEEYSFQTEENVFLFTDTEPGLRFYQRNGYNQIGVIEDFNKEGVHEIILRKQKKKER